MRMKRTTALLLLIVAASAMAQAPPATEALPGLETVHGMLPNGRGFDVQTILTRPAGARGRLPAVMLVQWLSCDSVEVGGAELDGMMTVTRRLALASAMVMLRVEKPGLGASKGPKCADTDFETELAGYRAGLEMLQRHPWVDPDRIFLVGMSNGGGILPLVAAERRVSGYVVINGWSKTWFEHMMELLRRDSERRQLPPGDVARRMRGFAELYAGYLLDKKLPGDVLRLKPHLANLWEGDPARQYGRPAAFYHQLQELNLAEAWSKVAAPTLVIWGDRDWIMSGDDHERIVTMVNRNHPGAARLVVVPGMDHFIEGDFATSVGTTVLAWLENHTRTCTSAASTLTSIDAIGSSSIPAAKPRAVP
jgi:pimeloyl-ACP methyl ester carboxylesterase